MQGILKEPNFCLNFEKLTRVLQGVGTLGNTEKHCKLKFKRF